MFIELTRLYDNKKILINLDDVSVIHPMFNDHTTIALKNGIAIQVVEDYKRIYRQLREHTQCI